MKKCITLLGALLYGLLALCDSAIYSGGISSDTYGTWTYDLMQTMAGERYIKITYLSPNSTYTDVVVPSKLSVPYTYVGSKYIDGNNMYIGYVSGTYDVRVVGGLNSTSLTSVIVPEGVTEISSGAFQYASSLTGIVLPSTLGTIGDSAFYQCGNLKKVTIPEGVTSLPSYCFAYCYNMTSISLPSTLTTISYNSFYYCRSLKSISIPNGVTIIPDQCFDQCSGLSSVSLPSSLKQIYGYAFRGCTNLRKINIPEGVSYIGSYCFASCTLLSDVTLPSTLQTLSSYAFQYCSQISSIQLPKYLQTISEAVFYGCSKLKAIDIPAAVTSLSDTFQKCSSLESINVNAENANYASVDGVLYNKALTQLYRCPCKMESITIPTTVTTISSYAFADCTELTSVSIPEGVTTIPEYAFDGAKNIVTITLPSTLTTLNSYSFQNCSSLKELIIPEGVTTIPSYCFTGCSSLATISLPSTLTLINSYGFYNCGLQAVTIPSGVTVLNTYAFANCTKLMSATLPQTLSTIADYVFNGCTQLKNITIPASVVMLSQYAFGSSNSTLEKVAFMGEPLSSFKNCLDKLSAKVLCTRANGAAWRTTLGVSYFGGFVDANRVFPSVTILSVGMRTTDPTILDVTYKVTSQHDKVDVRMLAFQGGNRNCTALIRPETFVDNTGANLGDGITANEPHTVSWRVTADWSVDLSSLAVDILAKEPGELLPLELESIPATTTHCGVQFSWNTITAQQYYDALLWLYASKESDLSLSNGYLYNNTTSLARYATDCNVNAAQYVLGKMGYSLMTASDVTYVNSLTKFALTAPSGVKQYAVKYSE